MADIKALAEELVNLSVKRFKNLQIFLKKSTESNPQLLQS